LATASAGAFCSACVGEAHDDAIKAFSTLSIETELAYRLACQRPATRAELRAFVEQAKQRLNVIATAAAVLP
jgi:hypothetical protein